VIFSYASCARQFIEASRRITRPWPVEPVLIGDGDESLAGADQEIIHLYSAHYAAGAVFGAARDGLPDHVPGNWLASPADLLARLPHGSVPGASLLHFGCHGSATVPVLATRLRLGTDPEGGESAVSVRDILRQARAQPPVTGEASGGLVILAACLTDVTEADYDEALTLATAFLAAGSSGVVAAKWPVSDSETALFMAAFHHFLNAGDPDADAAHALRRTQLWMLNPSREIPAAWPRALRERISPRLAQVWAWAGFTYQGR
jgi:hypothetical protein